MKPLNSNYLYPLLLALAICAASGTSRLATPDLGFTFSKDKLAHFLVFGLLATALLRTPGLKRRGLAGAVVAALLTSAYGAFDEFRQSMTPERSVEFADWVADTVGAIVAVATYSQWKAYREFLEWRRKKRPTERTVNN